jgi:hypothetical protein
MLWLPKKCPLSKCVDGSRYWLQRVRLSLAVVFEQGANCWNDGNYINVIMPEVCTSVCCHKYMSLQRLAMYSVARYWRNWVEKISAPYSYSRLGVPPASVASYSCRNWARWTGPTVSALSCGGLGQLLCGWLYEAVARIGLTYGVEGWYTEERDV